MSDSADPTSSRVRWLPLVAGLIIAVCIGAGVGLSGMLPTGELTAQDKDKAKAKAKAKDDYGEP